MNLIEKAGIFALNKHDGQTRKFSGESYIVHPRAVRDLLEDVYDITDENLLAAALLHDTIEDTNTTWKELEDEFNFEVAFLVWEVTKIKTVGKRKERWVKYLQHYREATHKGQLLKLAHRICNLQDYIDDFDLLDEQTCEFLMNVYLIESRDLYWTLYKCNKKVSDDLFSKIAYLEDKIHEKYKIGH